MAHEARLRLSAAEDRRAKPELFTEVVIMRWPWRRRRRPTWTTPNRIPDGDQVPITGYQRWADLLREEGDRPCR